MNVALTETRSGAARARRPTPVSPGSSAVLIATAVAADGAAAALQQWEGETLLARLAGQFASLGIERIHVITRPKWADAVAAVAGAEPHACEGPADDLRAIAQIADGAPGPLVVAYADIVTQREVLAGLLAEPRIATGVLSTGGPVARPYGYKTRGRRGRVVSAGSPYHAVRRPTGTFLGVLKIAPGDRLSSGRIAEQLAALLDPAPPPQWQEELDYKAGHWRRLLALMAMDRERGEPAPPQEVLDAAPLSPEVIAELERRRASAPDDVAALLLVGIVRSGVHVSVSRCAPCSGHAPGRRPRSSAQPRRSSSTTRTASCSTPRSRARTASSRRSSSRPTRSTSPAGRRSAG